MHINHRLHNAGLIESVCPFAENNLSLGKFLTRLFLLVLITSFSASEINAQFYNGSQQEFGKNRVQYKNFDWLYYPADHAEIYFYNGGKDLAEFTVQASEKSLEQVQQLFDYSMSDNIEIIVYNTQTDFRQSNVGVLDGIEDNIGGKTEIVGSKMFVYYDGLHSNLDEQIREGLAEVLFNQMMLGGNWKDVLRSSTFLTIPEWYKKGIISYAGNSYNSESDQYIRDGIKSGLYSSFNELYNEQVTYAGHALWKYIADVYGENVIPNILYMTKISRNIEDGFQFVLGQDLSTISREFVKYWKTKIEKEELGFPEHNINRLYSEKQLQKIQEWEIKDALLKTETISKLTTASSDIDSKSYKKLKLLVENWEILGHAGKKWRRLNKKWTKYLGAIPVKHKRKYKYSEFYRSPDLRYVSFATHEYGQYKLWLYEIESGKLKRIEKRDHKIDRIQDLTYPRITWHPNGDIITFINEERGRVYINNYQISTNKTETKELFRIDKVIDLAYSTDGKKIVFSGVAQGQTDLYMYLVIGNNQSKLTDDPYDDVDPSFIPNTESIIFSSNRPDDTLREDVPVRLYPDFKDIFILHTEDEKRLEQITFSPDKDEEQPKALNDKLYSYLSYNGQFKNQMTAYVDSAISRVDTTIHYRYFTKEKVETNFPLQLNNFQLNNTENTMGYSYYNDGRFKYNWSSIKDKKGTDLGSSTETTTPNDSPNGAQTKSEMLFIPDEETFTRQVDPLNYEFSVGNTGSGDIEKEIVRIQDMVDDSDTTAVAEEEFKLPKSRNYRLNFVIDEVTTQLDNSLGLQMYQSLTPTTNINQGGGIGGMAKASDLFEDYKLKGMVRLNSSLSALEGGLFFKDLSKRLDKEYTVQRFSNQSILPDIFWLGQNSILMGRYTLSYPLDEVRSIRGSALGILDEFKIFALDNTTAGQEIDRDIMGGLRLAYIYDNTRVKGLNLLEGTRYKIFAEYYQEVTKPDSDFKVIGVDFRHYQNIFRDLTFAIRGAGSTSFGGRTLLNILGGVDNELIPTQGDASISPDQGYYYISQSTPMRGFFQNSRSGTSFAVINSEVRWPIFQFFSKKPLNSEFTKSFMLNFFSDVGSAWTGAHPYSDENAFNQVEVETNPVQVTLENNREPVVWSYGLGVRAKILGYYVRADYGWGIDDQQRQDGVLHLSFSMDF